MNVYIGYRDLPEYIKQQGGFGGVPQNPDDRLATVENGVFLLTFKGADYAVSKERGEEFTEEVLSKCTAKHRGFFPFEPSYNGKTKAAVIEISKDHDYSYYDMDEEVLLEMLTALKDEAGDPLDRRGRINHCYPNPSLPEGDYGLHGITHQIYFIPSNKPVSVMEPVKPDKKTSRFFADKDGGTLCIREDNSNKEYVVPADLIPEIREKARQLCQNPVEAYVENGSWESFVEFGEGGKQRIFTSPDDTIALLKDIASKSVLKETEETDQTKQTPAPAPGIFTMNAQGFAQVISSSPQGTVEKCLYCGTPRIGNARFCGECGGEFK